MDSAQDNKNKVENATVDSSDPSLFSFLYVPVNNLYNDYFNDSEKAGSLVAIKAIYVSLFSEVERFLKKTMGLLLTKNDVLKMDENLCLLFRSKYPFFNTYSDDEIKEYLNFIVELRGLNSHYAHWSAPDITPTIAKVFEGLASKGTPVKDNRITFFGMALILDPIATSEMMNEWVLHLLKERRCFGPSAKKCGNMVKLLASLLIHQSRQNKEEKSVPANIKYVLPYNYICNVFSAEAIQFFFNIEIRLVQQLRRRYTLTGTNLSLLDGNLIDLMDRVNYLPDEKNHFLRKDIQLLRNLVFHGVRLEEEAEGNFGPITLTLDLFCDVLQRWNDAVPESERAFLRKDIKHFFTGIIHTSFARVIEISYKMRFRALYDPAKFDDRLSHLAKATDLIKNEVWPGYNASLGKILALFFHKKCLVFLNGTCFLAKGLPFTYIIWDQLVIEHYHSPDGLFIDGRDTKNTDLYLTCIPKTDLPLAKITDKEGNEFSGGERTLDGAICYVAMVISQESQKTLAPLNE
jgi:hypothetical protein